MAETPNTAASANSLLAGYTAIPDDDQRKAKAFFDKARTVADTGNYDYALEMMVQGMRLDPDSVEAHHTLREMSLKRKASGGKDLGIFDKQKYKGGKDDREAMLNAERLLFFDPGNTDHMLTFAQRAYGAGFFDTVMWIAPQCIRAVQDSGKPDHKKFLSLASLFKSLKQWDLAIQATSLAVQLRPNDMDLATELKNLGAMQTMDKGNYSGGGSYRDSVKDVKKQEELMRADTDVRSVDGMRMQIEAAERELAAAPDDAGKLMKLVDTLAKTEDADYETRALDKLEQAHKKTGNFRFRARIGEIHIKQMLRMERSLRDALKADPNDEGLKKDLADLQKDRISYELDEFKLLMAEYPTESRYKYEVAVRLFALHKYDEAIPSLQQARQDPKFRGQCSVYLGRAFFEAQFYDEAFDTLEEVITTHATKGDELSKEMYYWRARALEAKESFDPAIKSYSQVAQWDFNYRDVQTRIKALRARPK